MAILPDFLEDYFTYHFNTTSVSVNRFFYYIDE